MAPTISRLSAIEEGFQRAGWYQRTKRRLRERVVKYITPETSDIVNSVLDNSHPSVQKVRAEQQSSELLKSVATELCLSAAHFATSNTMGKVLTVVEFVWRFIGGVTQVSMAVLLADYIMPFLRNLMSDTEKDSNCVVVEKEAEIDMGSFFENHTIPYLPTLAGIMGVVACVLLGQLTKTFTVARSMFKHWSGFGKDMKGVQMGLEAGSALYVWAVERMQECLVKLCPDYQVRGSTYETCLAFGVDTKELLENYGAFRDPGEWPVLFGVPSTGTKVSSIFTSLEKIDMEIAKKKLQLPVDVQQLFGKIRTEMRDFAKQYATHRSLPLVRRCPFNVYIYGDSGCGKSETMNSMAHDVPRLITGFATNRRGVPEGEPGFDVSNLCYSKAAADPYWSRYNNQTVVALDDIFQGRAAVPSDSEAMNYICMHSGVMWMPPKPIAEEKGEPFKGLLTLCTSNDGYPQFTEIRHNEAVWRRRNVLVKQRVDTAGDGKVFKVMRPLEEQPRTQEQRPSVFMRDGFLVPEIKDEWIHYDQLLRIVSAEAIEFLGQKLQMRTHEENWASEMEQLMPKRAEMYEPDEEAEARAEARLGRAREQEAIEIEDWQLQEYPRHVKRFEDREPVYTSMEDGMRVSWSNENDLELMLQINKAKRFRKNGHIAPPSVVRYWEETCSLGCRVGTPIWEMNRRQHLENPCPYILNSERGYVQPCGHYQQEWPTAHGMIGCLPNNISAFIWAEENYNYHASLGLEPGELCARDQLENVIRLDGMRRRMAAELLIRMGTITWECDNDKHVHSDWTWDHERWQAGNVDLSENVLCMFRNGDKIQQRRGREVLGRREGPIPIYKQAEVHDWMMMTNEEDEQIYVELAGPLPQETKWERFMFWVKMFGQVCVKHPMEMIDSALSGGVKGILGAMLIVTLIKTGLKAYNYLFGSRAESGETKTKKPSRRRIAPQKYGEESTYQAFYDEFKNQLKPKVDKEDWKRVSNIFRQKMAEMKRERGIMEDDNMAEVMDLQRGSAFVANNCIDLTNEDTMGVLNGVALRGQTFMTLKHFFPDPTKTYTVTMRWANEEQTHEITPEERVDAKSRGKCLSADLVFVTIKTKKWCFRNIVGKGYFTREADFDRLMNGEMDLLYRQETAQGSRVVAAHSNFQMVEEIEYKTKAGEEVHLPIGFEYRVSAMNRRCGAAMFHSTPGVKGSICGVHVAGRSITSEGNAACISEEWIQSNLGPKEAEVQLPPFMSGDVLDLKGSDIAFVEEENRNWAVHPEGSLHYVATLKPKYAEHVVCKTDIIESELHGKIFPVMTGPSVKTGKDKRLIKDFNDTPMNVGAKKFTKTVSDFAADKLALACSYVLAVILAYRPMTDVPRVLSEHEAINGVKHMDYHRLNMKTSSGWLLKRFRPLGAKGKAWLFENTSTDEEPIYRIKHPYLRKLVDDLERAYQGGKRRLTIFYANLKDERRPLAKILMGKTRLFECLSIEHTILTRKYFGMYCATMNQNAANSPFAVGLDVESPDWTRLYRRLNKNGGMVVHGDYEAWDGRLSAQVMRAGAEVINRWYSAEAVLKMRERPERLMEFQDEITRDNRVRLLLIEDVIECYTVYGNMVLRKEAGLPSGMAMTSDFNSLCNLIYMCTAAYSLRPSGSKLNLQDWEFTLYGDDNIVAPPRECQWFNFNTLSAFFKSHGIVYTDALKKGGIQDDYTALSEATFLKRGFRTHERYENRMWAPIEKVVITELINWVRTGGCPREALFSNIEDALNFAYHHGKRYHDELLGKINDAIYAENVRNPQSVPTWRTISTTFEERDQQWCANFEEGANDNITKG